MPITRCLDGLWVRGKSVVAGRSGKSSRSGRRGNDFGDPDYQSIAIKPRADPTNRQGVGTVTF